LNPILLTAQHLNNEIIKLTQRIKDLERELLREGEEQSENESQHLKQGGVSGDETVHPSPRR
jgi:phosphohistidine phosphatase SixA